MPRTTPTLDLERALLTEQDVDVIIAVDEVGRGALAGPVTLGAVAIAASTGDAPEGVRDSKQLSAAQRAQLAPKVAAWARVSNVVDVPATRIDDLGIVRALGEGALSVVSALAGEHNDDAVIVLLDGHHDFLTPAGGEWRVRTVIKGDASCASIAAASIIAKVHRDQVMKDLHLELPHYGWERNVGYGTEEHRRAMRAHGVSEHHRRSWRLIAEPTLDFPSGEY